MAPSTAWSARKTWAVAAVEATVVQRETWARPARRPTRKQREECSMARRSSRGRLGLARSLAFFGDAMS
jgi:hypothetical protein